ncbi:hypothetical protein Tco_1554394 [Tanacetum coccineum]
MLETRGSGKVITMEAQANNKTKSIRNQWHYRSDRLELKNRDHGNQAEGTEARGMVCPYLSEAKSTLPISKNLHRECKINCFFTLLMHPYNVRCNMATDEAITRANEWTNKSLIAERGTNLLLPLKQAFDMVGKTGAYIPLIFYITDGSVETHQDPSSGLHMVSFFLLIVIST